MNYLQFLESADIKDSYQARALYAQATHETGRFTSRVYREAKNMFGMRPATKRTKFYTSILNTNQGQYASYADIGDSLVDRLDWDNDWNLVMPRDGTEIQPYIDAVKSKKYAEDPDYTKIWYDWYLKLFPYDEPLESDHILRVDSTDGGHQQDVHFRGEAPHGSNKDTTVPEKSIWGIILVLVGAVLVGSFFMGKKN